LGEGFILLPGVLFRGGYMIRYDGNEQYVRNEVFAATATSQVVCQPNFRSVLYFRNNDAAQVVTLAFGSSVAVANYGVVLQPGQAYIESNSEGFQTYTGTVSIIATGNANVSVMER